MIRNRWKLQNIRVIFLNCLHSVRKQNKLKSYEKVCKNKDFCGIVMPSGRDKILRFIQYIKSDKISCIIYADIEYLISKKDECANNPENSSTTQSGEHNPCGYSMLEIRTFDHIENRHKLCCAKNCMKKFSKSLREQSCKSLREQAKNSIDFEKKIMLPLIKK